MKNELRAGNIANIMLVASGPKPVALIPNALITNDDLVDSEEFSGVELNETWLLLLGFDKSGDRFELAHGYGTEDAFSFSFDEAGLYLYPSNEGLIHLPHIRFVHQVQNLFFCLSGKELFARTKQVVRYELNGATVAGISLHPDKDMRRLGYNVTKFEGHPIGDCIFMEIECVDPLNKNRPLPEYVVPVDWKFLDQD